MACFLALVVLPTLVLASDGTYDTANESTPVRFLNCDSLGNECFVSARFKDLDSCERYKVFNTAYCDYVSIPGKISCDTTRTNYSKSFCTK